jgi:hypothetical protein
MIRSASEALGFSVLGRAGYIDGSNFTNALFCADNPSNRRLYIPTSLIVEA